MVIRDGQDVEGKRKKGELWVERSLKEGTDAELANSTEVSRQGCLEFGIYGAPASQCTQPKQPGRAEITLFQRRQPAHGVMGIAGGVTAARLGGSLLRG